MNWFSLAALIVSSLSRLTIPTEDILVLMLFEVPLFLEIFPPLCLSLLHLGLPLYVCMICPHRSQRLYLFLVKLNSHWSSEWIISISLFSSSLILLSSQVLLVSPSSRIFISVTALFNSRICIFSWFPFLYVDYLWVTVITFFFNSFSIFIIAVL